MGNQFWGSACQRLTCGHKNRAECDVLDLRAKVKKLEDDLSDNKSLHCDTINQRTELLMRVKELENIVANKEIEESTDRIYPPLVTNNSVLVLEAKLKDLEEENNSLDKALTAAKEDVVNLQKELSDTVSKVKELELTNEEQATIIQTLRGQINYWRTKP